MVAVLDRLGLDSLFDSAVSIWLAGGWAMIALSINAFLLFFLGSTLWLKFRQRAWRNVPESEWRRWIGDPALRRGRFGENLGFILGSGNLDEIGVRFAEVRAAEIDPYERDLRFMKRCVSTAPLLGLLGTVTGMLATFGALASGSGGEKTMALVADGISEALITTETGLLIALPGLFFQYHLARERARYDAFLARVESACTQHLFLHGRSATP
jgi:biopolymer transport protein ExbB